MVFLVRYNKDLKSVYLNMLQGMVKDKKSLHHIKVAYEIW